MPIQKTLRFNFTTACLMLLCLLVGCSPQFDWREVHGAGPAPYTVLLPGKPATMARAVNLGGINANMQMTATEVDGISFAIGSAELIDATQAKAALAAMKAAMVQNIKGTIRLEKTIGTPAAPGIEIEATGRAANGQSRVLLAHFIVRDRHAYQVILLSPKATVPAEITETFFSSFKPD